LERQLFENITRPTKVGNGKTKQYPLMLSVLFHLVAVIIWITFVSTVTHGPPDISKPVAVFSGSVYFGYPKPLPPPLPPKRKLETKKPDKPVEKIPELIHPVVPAEVPSEIKPEPPKEPEESLSDDNSGEEEGTIGGVPGGIPGGVSGGVVEESPSPGSSKSSQGPVEVKRNINYPKKIKHFQPIYPSGAIQARVEGTVVVEAIIGKDGKIKSAKIIKSVPLLDSAALEAVKKWEYTPMIIDGEAKEIPLTVTINFKLK